MMAIDVSILETGIFIFILKILPQFQYSTNETNEIYSFLR